MKPRVRRPVYVVIFVLFVALLLVPKTPSRDLGGPLALLTYTLRDMIPKPVIEKPDVNASYQQNYNALAVEVERKYPFLSADRYYGWDNSYMFGVRMRQGSISVKAAKQITDAILPRFRAIGGTQVMFWDTSKNTGATIAES